VSNINTVVVSGRLTRDPELRTTNSGVSVANTGIAVEQYVKDAEPKVSFFDLTIWSGFADLCAKKARKGDTVTVEGRLHQNQWETDSGEKRSKVEIVVNQMEGEFLYRKADGSDTPASTLDGGSAATGGQPAAAVASDDDIPF